MFNKSVKEHKSHHDVLSKKFDEMLKIAKENPDEPPPKRDFDLRLRALCSVRTLENTSAGRESLRKIRDCPLCPKAHSMLQETALLVVAAWTERAVPNFSPRPLSPAFSSPSLPDRRAEKHSRVPRRHSWHRSGVG